MKIYPCLTLTTNKRRFFAVSVFVKYAKYEKTAFSACPGSVMVGRGQTISAAGAVLPHQTTSKIKEDVHMNNTSKISSLKTLRLRNETIEYFKGKPLNKVVDNLVELIKEGKIELDGEKLRVRGSLDGVPEDLIADIELIGKFDNMTMGEILKELHFALDREDIMLVDKHFFYK